MHGVDRALIIRLTALEGPGPLEARPGDRRMEFHVSREARDFLALDEALFTTTGNIILPDFHASRALARRINERVDASILPERTVRAGRLNAMALIDEILHDVARLYREKAEPGAFAQVLADLDKELGTAATEQLLLIFVQRFPPIEVYRGEASAQDWLAGLPAVALAGGGQETASLRHEQALEELLLLRLANENPAFGPFKFLFDETLLDGAPESVAADYAASIPIIERRFALLPSFGPDSQDLVTMLRSPALAAPYSLPGQLDYIRSRWGLLLGDKLLRLLGGLDLIREEEKPRFPGPGPTRAYVYSGMEHEYERFSADRDWMPNVVMMAKSSLVWLHQLSVQHGRELRTLDAIPDEELDSLASRGFNALWLIGLWERSGASAEIKRRCGNPEAAASAYSLFDYEIAGELGGWPALERLRERCGWRGIRLAADMVPNHTGIDSSWVRERPGLFVQSDRCPYPGYSFNGGDLSGDPRIGLWIEDHYYDRSDAAVVFKRLDRSTGAVSYIYHGNDGTGLPWSDTAQIDFLKAESREAVKERILHVARNFPIIRFDAAMILARKHFRRLWYPEPGSGGDVPSRAEAALPRDAFDAAMPEEFWREVVDLCAKEAPDTLLLAEAFWMMEGYFVRTLGMHRVYNSAFMNMLKREENSKYRDTIKNTQDFDKDILKRFVNFMNNPDEETAVAQFGKGDKYFGVCTMMATMPGLPMFGHGQLEGFEEKYGMEYRRAYRDEKPDRALVERHEHEIFPLLKRRRLFAEVKEFLLYDLVGPGGSVNENVFAYSNAQGGEHALVVYNNAYARAEGRIRVSCSFAEKTEGAKHSRRRSLASAFGLRDADKGGREPAPGNECFVAMREQRSGLWYLRRSREIAEEGLSIILEGYQSQVFLDIFEIADDARGLYRAVYDGLGGSGTGDLAAAIQDVALKELYAALADFLSPGFLRAFGRRIRPSEAAERPNAYGTEPAGAAPSLAGPAAEAEAAAEPAAESEGGSEVLAAAALEFYRVVRSILRVEAAEEGLPGDPAPADKKTAPAAQALILAKRDKAVVRAAADRFLAGFASLEGLGGPGIVASQLALPGMAELALCYLVLDGLRALVGAKKAGEESRRLAEKLYLERKLREALREAGIAGDEAYRGVHLARILLSWTGVPAQGSGKPAELAARGLEDEDLRSILGVNLFDGVTWFNKERFEETVRIGALMAAITAAWPKTAARSKTKAEKPLEQAEAMARYFLDAAERSGYRLDELIEGIGSQVKGKKR